MARRLDLTGQRFGRLVALEPTKKKQNGSIVWLCKCDCGKQCPVRSNSLRDGHTKSCGCFSKEMTKKRSTTHGMRNSPIYDVWHDMIQRCENPKKATYKYYGGRGIKVCKRWHTFKNFYADVGDKPEGMTLDRWPDNDGNYEPGNWRWATRSQQRFNSRPASCGPMKQYWFRAWHKNSMAQYLSNNQCEFARKWDLGSSSISACLCGKQKTCKNWTFQCIK